jgi:hypothetical protein
MITANGGHLLASLSTICTACGALASSGSFADAYETLLLFGKPLAD